MKQYLQKISGETLLAVGGCALFFTFGTWLVISLLVNNVPLQKEEVIPVPQELAGNSFFEIGQYYFNHDDDTSGPYDLDKAKYFYNKEISQNPQGNDLVWYQLGRVDFINGDFDEALSKFDTQIAYFGDAIPNVHYMIGLTYGYKARITGDPDDWKKGEDAFIKFINMFPEAPWSRVDLAWIYFSQGKYAEMQGVLEEGIRYESNNPWLLNMYGLYLLNTGDKTMAKEYFAFALELAQKMSVEEWGKSYPGNNPELWGKGLAEFKEIISKNVVLSQK